MQAGYYQYVIDLQDKLSPTMKKASKNVSGSLRKFDQGVNKTLGGVKGLVAAAGGLAVFKTAFDSAVNIEQNQIAFQTLTKDVEKGNKLFKELTEFANVTPFQTDEVQRAGKTLLAFGTSAENVKNQMKLIGDVSAITNKPIDEMARIYGKIQANGRLMGEELNQLIDGGFNPLSIISEKTGKTQIQLRKEMEKGLITFDMVQDAFKTATSEGGAFNNGMEKLSQTLGGKWSTFVGKMQNQLGELALKFQDTFSGAIDKMIAFADWIGKNQKEFIQWIKIIGYAVAALGSLIIAIKAWIVVQNIINAVMAANPIGLIVIGIVAMTAAITIAIKKWETWGKYLTYLLGTLGFTIRVIMNLVNGIREVFKGFQSGGFLEGIKRLGFALLDSLLMPFKAILYTVSLLPGSIGKAAGSAYAKLDALTKTQMQKEEQREKQRQQKKSADFWKRNAGVGQNIANNTSGVNPLDVQASTQTQGDTKKTTQTGGIINGGKKQTVINVTLENLIENMNLNSKNLTEGSEQIKKEVTKALLQVLNSANYLAT